MTNAQQAADVERALVGAGLVLELDNDPCKIEPLVSHLRERWREWSWFDQESELQLALAVHEALVKALYHGNLELSSAELVQAAAELSAADWVQWLSDRCGRLPYRDRRIFVRAGFSRGRAEVTVRDEGPGFDRSQLADPTRDEALYLEHGRGIFLMRAFASEVHFNAAGNEVTLVKRCTSASCRRAG